MKLSGKPDAGNPHVRFDEGDQRQLWSLLYRSLLLLSSGRIAKGRVVPSVPAGYSSP